MNRAQRLLSIYTRLIHHQRIDKTSLADEFNVNERTIKRDIQEIRNYLYDNEEWLMKKDILFNWRCVKLKLKFSSKNFKKVC
ncbi:HTH domain-containing protein [Staphylococcus intermedius]|uniref:HTH domain-containing protein n=1 Tax=Staphylococcus intermedius TaxID=1285 RepID=UPI0003653B40|nr:HTH domain-containing protein [Staphylococcus intermedius]PCF64095.1 hypothetical protein B5C04_08970 [Staphylococcus intermedius]PCF78811.1 hypothetical protein B4W74_09320 [Staphylococcus intermedius]PCF79783.1 hypothetical protein B4W70_08960 [Staphylococcus intermedius]PCF89558.1 hypothetical protein B4W75_01585 [Staphylococcus intermedius]